MNYFLALILIVVAARGLSGSWRQTFILPWVVAAAPMLSGAALANLGLIPALIAPWSPATHAVVIAGTAALVAGSFTLRYVRCRMSIDGNDAYWDEQMLLRVLLFITGVAFIANTAQFLIAGEIPIFSADPDHARMAASKNGYIHIFSVLSGHIIPIAALVLCTGKSLHRTTRRILAGIILLNFLLLLMWVARGMLIYPVVTAIAIHYLLDQKSFGFRKTVTAALICIVIVSGVKYLRDVMRFGFDYNPVASRVATSGFRRTLAGNSAVLYLTIAMNYEILNRYTASVPVLAPHSHGRIMAGNLTAYLPGSGAAFTELAFQNAVLKKKEQDYTLTSTFFGVPYLDFGFPGVIVLSFCVGLLYRVAWLRMFTSGSPWSIYLYGYLISMAVFIPYTFLFTQVSFTWFLLSSFPIIFLCSCRVKGASLLHQRRRVNFQQVRAD